MSRHDIDDVPWPPWATDLARGKPVTFARHALHGMDAERPRVSLREVTGVLDAPDHDDGKEAWRWVGTRTIKVYYREEERHIHVRAVSATRRRLRP